MDNAKFILIVLVIIGHCLEKFSSQGMNGSLYNTIYTFHMPLFIFITGYFTNTNKDKGKYFDGVLSLFLTFCIFQLFWFIFYRDFSVNAIINPAWTLWYLLSTIYWKCLIYPLRKIDHKILFGCSVIVALFGGFVPISILSIPRTLTFAPFFVLGYIARARNFDFSKLRSIYLIVPSVVLMLGCLFTLKGDFSWLLFGSKNYHLYNCQTLIAPLYRLVALMIGGLFSACILAYAPSISATAKYGQNTLFYYLYHTIIIVALIYVIAHLHISKSIPLFLICTTIVIISLLVAEKIPLLGKILRPYDIIKGEKK